MTRKERLEQRNNLVRKYFYDIKDKNPKWRIDAVIDEVAAKVFLSSRTVDAIISYEGVYNDSHLPPKQNTSQLKMF
jgi:ADP-heptose:LPS heptosyltransferase